MKTMKKIQYQNQLRKLFLEQQDDKKEVSTDKENERKEVIKLLHQDWACKVPDARLKFLPDFETLKKPGFGYIRELDYILFHCHWLFFVYFLRHLHLVKQGNHRSVFSSKDLSVSSVQWLHSCSRHHRPFMHCFCQQRRLPCHGL